MMPLRTSIRLGRLEERGIMGVAVRKTGLLIAMMEPHALLEEEFQQWYDIEHFPERAGTEGFQTATRAVCIEGWPRYVALYDLSNIDVLKSPAYGKIARDNYSQWTHRVVSRAWGHYRAEALQVYPGGALIGANGACSRIVLWRFRNVAASEAALIVSGLRTIYEGQPETAQLRVFESDQGDAADYIGVIELYVPWTPPSGSVGVLGPVLRHVDMVNVYAHYYPSEPVPNS
jgi:hypothetical protein